MNHDPQLEYDLPPWRVAIACTVVASALLLPASESVDAQMADQPQFGTETVVEPTDFEKLPDGPCKIPHNPKEPERTPEACARAEQDGHIALVNFDLPTDVANQIARDTQEGLRNATGGMIQATVEAIPASAQTKLELLKNPPEGACADNGNVETWPAVIADTHMPRTLRSADFVIGLADFQFCNENIAGSADNPGKGRHATVGLYLQGDPERVRAEGYAKGVAAVAIHEMGHLFTLGHSGLLRSQDGKRLCIRDNMLANSPQPFDLLAYVSTACSYGEYANMDIMGVANFPRKPQIPDALKVYSLIRAARGPEEMNELPGRLITDEAVSFTGDDPRRDDFGLISFDGASVLLVDEASKGRRAPSEQIFDTLAIVPVRAEKIKTNEEDARVIGADLILYDSYGNVQVLIGFLTTRELEGGAAYTLKLGKRVVRITAESGTLTVEPVVS